MSLSHDLPVSADHVQEPYSAIMSMNYCHIVAVCLSVHLHDYAHELGDNFLSVIRIFLKGENNDKLRLFHEFVLLFISSQLSMYK